MPLIMDMPYKEKKDRISVSLERDLYDFIYNQQKVHETLNATLRRLLKL